MYNLCHIKTLIQDCFYCGGKPETIHKCNTTSLNIFKYNGIDRLDNKIGYVKTNCVTYCKTCCVFCVSE